MTADQSRDARIRLVEEHFRAENAHDVDAIMETFGLNPSFQINATQLDGSENIRAMYGGIGFGDQGSFSNLKATIQRQHIAEDSIVTEVLLSGKHTDTWQGIPPTNRDFEIPLIAIFEFDSEERLSGERIYFDGALMLQQLGIM